MIFRKSYGKTPKYLNTIHWTLVLRWDHWSLGLSSLERMKWSCCLLIMLHVRALKRPRKMWIMWKNMWHLKHGRGGAVWRLAWVYHVHTAGLMSTKSSDSVHKQQAVLFVFRLQWCVIKYTSLSSCLLTCRLLIKYLNTKLRTLLV